MIIMKVFMVIVVGNGHSDLCSNSCLGYSHFTLR